MAFRGFQNRFPTMQDQKEKKNLIIYVTQMLRNPTAFTTHKFNSIKHLPAPSKDSCQEGRKGALRYTNRLLPWPSSWVQVPVLCPTPRPPPQRSWPPHTVSPATHVASSTLDAPGEDQSKPPGAPAGREPYTAEP